MLKRIGLIFSSGLFKIALVSLALTVAGWATFGTADKIKQSAEDSKLYDSLAINILENAKQDAVGQNTQLPVDRPEIEQAAKDALSSEQLSKSGDSLINGFYSWLQGKTDQPEFEVSLNESKNRFANSVAGYAQERYEELPACTFDQLRALNPDIDPFSVECRVPNITGADVRERVLQNILNNDQFLQGGTFTSEDLPKDANGKTFAENFSAAPDVYEAVGFLQWILGYITVLLAVGVLFLSKTKRKGLKTIGTTLLGTGLFLALGSWLITWTFKQMNSQGGDPLQNSLFDALRVLIDSYNGALVKFAVVYAVLGAGILLSLWYQKRTVKSNQVDQTVSTDATVQGTDSSDLENK